MPSASSPSLPLQDALPISLAASEVSKSTLGCIFPSPACPAVATCTWYFASMTDSWAKNSPRRDRGTHTSSTSSPPPMPATYRSDRKSTRLNSSHVATSYAVCLQPQSSPTGRSSDLTGRVGGVEEHARVHIPVPGVPGRGDLHLVLRIDDRQLGEELPEAGPRNAHIVDELSPADACHVPLRSEEHTSELQSRGHLVCRLPPAPVFPYRTLFRSHWPRRRCRRARSGAYSRPRRARPWRPAPGTSHR